MRVRDGGWIASARRRAGYTQYDLAALSKCTQATVSALETGAMTGCSEDLAKTIAKWVGRDVEELFEAHDGTRLHRVTNAAGSTRRPPSGPTTQSDRPAARRGRPPKEATNA